MKSIDLPPGHHILLDELGATGIMTSPAGEIAVLMEIGGKRNRVEQRHRDFYLLDVGQAAELVAELTLAVGDADAIDRFLAEAIAAINRKRP